MLHVHELPAPEAGVYTNAAGKIVTDQQRRALRKLLRDLVAFTGTAIADIKSKPRNAPRRGKQQTRVLFRRADRLSDADIDQLIREIGAGRLMAGLDRWSQPSLFA